MFVKGSVFFQSKKKYIRFKKFSTGALRLETSSYWSIYTHPDVGIENTNLYFNVGRHEIQ